MRLYKAKTLQEYIDQLKEDIKVLQKVADGQNHQLVEFYDANRDSLGNHSPALSNHRELLRHERIKNAKTNS